MSGASNSSTTVYPDTEPDRREDRNFYICGEDFCNRCGDCLECYDCSRYHCVMDDADYEDRVYDA